MGEGGKNLSFHLRKRKMVTTSLIYSRLGELYTNITRNSSTNNLKAIFLSRTMPGPLGGLRLDTRDNEEFLKPFTESEVKKTQ